MPSGQFTPAFRVQLAKRTKRHQEERRAEQGCNRAAPGDLQPSEGRASPKVILRCLEAPFTPSQARWSQWPPPRFCSLFALAHRNLLSPKTTSISPSTPSVDVVSRGALKRLVRQSGSSFEQNLQKRSSLWERRCFRNS